MGSQKVLIASDHGGFRLKNHLITCFPEIEWIDLGPENDDRVDYPDFADRVASKINGSGGIGVLCCGSGQGMAMRANKYPNVRAALCWSVESCELARGHNKANILCLGERLLDLDLTTQIFETFLNIEFEGGRHEARVEKISSAKLEESE